MVNRDWIVLTNQIMRNIIFVCLSTLSLQDDLSTIPIWACNDSSTLYTFKPSVLTYKPMKAPKWAYCWVIRVTCWLESIGLVFVLRWSVQRIGRAKLFTSLVSLCYITYVSKVDLWPIKVNEDAGFDADIQLYPAYWEYSANQNK